VSAPININVTAKPASNQIQIRQHQYGTVFSQTVS